MSAIEILQSVQFLVGSDGQPTGAVLSMDVWELFIAWLEDRDDIQAVQDGLARLQAAEGNLEAAGLIPWSQVTAELDQLDGEPPLHA